MLLYYEPKVCSTNVAINFGYSKLMDKNKEELLEPIPLLKTLYAHKVQNLNCMMQR